MSRSAEDRRAPPAWSTGPVRLAVSPDPTLSAWAKAARAETGGKDAACLYTHRDTARINPGLPGAFPYRRGIKASAYAGRPWTIRQYAGFSTAEESNAFFRRALAEGQRGLSVAFDLATHRGYDSDDPGVSAEVGLAGVAVDTVEDMKALFAGIPLGEASVSMTMNGAVLPILAFYVVAAEEQGFTPATLQGTIQNDILKEFITRNTYIYPPQPSMRIVADAMAYAARHMPRFNPISVSGYHLHEAGATPVQELAFTLANALEYVRAGRRAGLTVDEVAGRMSFFFAIGMDLFTEVAKLRAARALWAHLMQAEGATDPRAMMLRTHCQTSGVSLAAQEPHNNVVRTTIEALAAVLGGTQSLHTNAFDEALALPSDAAARLARNTQLILEHETGVADVVDPLGGSYYVEALTRDLEEAARAEIEAIEASGGMLAAAAEGGPSRQIAEAAALKQARFDSGQSKVVGVNLHRTPDADTVAIRRLDNDATLRVQHRRLAEVKGRRDGDRVHAALSALREGARGEESLMGLALEAARARCTVGEISQALADVFGRHSAHLEAPRGIYGAAVAADAQAQTVRRQVAAFSMVV